MDEVDTLVHSGLIKKYRTVRENQIALKGRLDVTKQITENLVHAERFYVRHPVYDRDNLFNAVLAQAIHHIEAMRVSSELNQRCAALLLSFPNCKSLNISEKLFKSLVFDRKSERYRNALEIARIILFNFHPDVRGGQNHILAIMFDMNKLWENYVYWILKRLERTDSDLKVTAQGKRDFWKHPSGGSLRLRPDIVISRSGQNIVIDTKWKYRSDTSIQDVRQMYAYGHYFQSIRCYLIYPDRLIDKVVSKQDGKFHDLLDSKQFQDRCCGLVFVDMLRDGVLNLSTGEEILKSL